MRKSTDTISDLKERAEAQAPKQDPEFPEETDALTPATMRRLLHELRVHQIEL